MGIAIEKINQLSEMRRTLARNVTEDLRGDSGRYLDRLTAVAERSFMRGHLVGGTTISRPSILTHGKRGRLTTETMAPGFSMYVRDIPTEHGFLVIFPMRTVDISEEGTPVIELPGDEKFYTVAHVPKNPNGGTEKFNPAGMTVDLAFTVDCDNYITVNGLNAVTAEEHTLFDEIVCEFESRLDTDD